MTASSSPSVGDSAFLTHNGGKIEIAQQNTQFTAIRDYCVYTPGVLSARPSTTAALRMLLHKENTVAVVTERDRSLGMGTSIRYHTRLWRDAIGVHFKQFKTNVDAWPVAWTRDPGGDHLIVRPSRPAYGGINGTSPPPSALPTSGRLRELDIPVFHDQHGTTIVTWRPPHRALKIGRRSDVRIVLSGVSAAGGAIAQTAQRTAPTDIVGFCRHWGPLSAADTGVV